MSVTDPFQIPWHTGALASLVSRFPKLWKWLGSVESAILADELEEITIDRPVYVAGLARSGSTILLEAIAAQCGVVTHQYRDFPFIFTPYWWQAGKRQNRKEEVPQERAHRDGLFVTPESPEAMEEMIWMAFFRDLHNPKVSNLLGPDVSHPRFEKFYSDHIKKLLLSREGKRYASKENYNITRLQYLLKIFPDARIVIPIRHPVDQVASLMKQHRLFSEGEQRNPRALKHMGRVGHFEFGLDLRLINTGDSTAMAEIESIWQQGEYARGWARYWASIYNFIADQLAADGRLRDAVKIVRYEQLTESPHQMLSEILEHCRLDDVESCDRFATKIHPPTYYQPDFTDAEVAAVYAETAEVAERFEYDLVASC